MLKVEQTMKYLEPVPFQSKIMYQYLYYDTLPGFVVIRARWRIHGVQWHLTPTALTACFKFSFQSRSTGFVIFTLNGLKFNMDCIHASIYFKTVLLQQWIKTFHKKEIRSKMFLILTRNEMKTYNGTNIRVGIQEYVTNNVQRRKQIKKLQLTYLYMYSRNY